MLPDLNRLRIFYYIFSAKSVVAAAGKLHITQSAVSQHLQKLEREIQTRLFTRLHKKLVPTMAGERLFALVRPFIENLENSIGEIRQAQQVPSGPIRVGAPPEFGRLYLPGIFASFREDYPEVVFFLKLGDPAVLLSMAGEGELDFALVDMFPIKGQTSEAFSPFSIEPLIEEEVILACSKKYYQAAVKNDHSFDHLSALSFIEYRRHAVVVKNWFRHHFHRAPSRLNTVMTVDSIQAVISGIRSHLGLGVIATHMAWTEISSGDLAPIRTQEASALNQISLALLKDKVPTLSERTFLGHLRNQIRVGAVLKDFRRLGA